MVETGSAMFALRVVALSGTVIGPVAVWKVMAESMSSLTLGVNVTVSGAETPADMRPGGTCVRSKKEATAMGKSCGRKALKEYETLVIVNLSSYVLPTSKSAKSNSAGLHRKGGPFHSLPPTTCLTIWLAF